MNCRLLSLLGAGWLAAIAAAQPSDAIRRLTLNPMVVTTIPVALDRLTTIRFPSPLSDLQAALVAAEPLPDALFLVTFQAGNAFFSVRALAPGTNTSLNVVWKNQTYVLELVESRSPWLSVIFDAPAEPATNPAPKTVSVRRLLGMLDTARSYAVLRQYYPSSVADVQVVRPNSLRDYGDYTIRVEEVFRFDAQDALVFRIGVSNKTQSIIRYLPESLMVRAGQRVYYQSMTEAPGVLPAAAEVPIYFAISGSADGSLNSISPHNDFMVLLCRLESPTQPDLPLIWAPASQTDSIPPGLALPRPPPPSVATPLENTNADWYNRLIKASDARWPPSPASPAPAPTGSLPVQSQPAAPPVAHPAGPSS
jgi:hypothetical protein